MKATQQKYEKKRWFKQSPQHELGSHSSQQINNLCDLEQVLIEHLAL